MALRSDVLTDGRVFYGPHECGDCGKLIVKASYTQGGEAFDQPEGPIYPNTEWHRHNCDQSKQAPLGPPGVLP